jgi:hypothetical protein
VPPDRAGQVFEGRGPFGTSPITILRWLPIYTEPHHDGLWVAEADDFEGRPFTFTIAEYVLKRKYRRVREPA